MKKLKLSLLAVAVSCAVGVAWAGLTENHQPLFNIDDTHQLFTIDENNTSRKNTRADYLSSDPRVQESWTININAALISADTQKVVLPLQDGSTVSYYLSDFKKEDNKISVWMGGYLPKQVVERYGTQGTVAAENQAIFVRSGENITATLTINGEHYSVEPLGNGEHALIKVDETFSPEEPEPLEVTRVPFNQSDIEPPTTQHSNIRVLIVTPKETFQKVTEFESKVAALFAEANLGNKQSLVNISFEYAGIYTAKVADSGDLFKHIYAMENPENILGKQVALARERHRADLVVWLGSNEKNSNTCGISYINASKESAFSAMSTSCIGRGVYSFAHLLGSNMGLRRNYDGTHTDVPAYAYGYSLPNVFRTIMSNKIGSEKRVNYWSNPAVLYNGSSYTMGQEKHANAARRLNEVRDHYANFYPPLDQEQMVAPIIKMDQQDMVLVRANRFGAEIYPAATSDQSEVIWNWERLVGDDNLYIYDSSSNRTVVSVPKGMSNILAKFRARATNGNNLTGETTFTVTVVDPAVTITGPASMESANPAQLQAETNFETEAQKWELLKEGQLIADGINQQGQIKAGLEPGRYQIKVFAADYEMGREATDAFNIEVTEVADAIAPVVELNRTEINAVATVNANFGYQVSATGNQEDLSWQWEYVAGDKKLYVKPTSTATAEIVVPKGTLTTSTQFRVRATNAANLSGEALVTVNVILPSVIITGPASMKNDQPVKLGASANFDKVTYEWKIARDNQQIDNAIDQTGQLQAGLAPGNYVVQVLARSDHGGRTAVGQHVINVTGEENTDQAFIDGLNLRVEVVEENAASITFAGKVSSSSAATNAPAYQWQWADEAGNAGSAETRFTVKKGLRAQTLTVTADVSVGQLSDTLSEQFIVPARKLTGIN